ncbi:MAG: 23S rRNA methyltransferase [Legionellales bacterium RIFCSPHIGHO2_12_FULL_42_9]|nr:MAG: 23S rRNA methyltransferase [Legionellales bacterium RIFCSPHIGHO2_12_FULL_42_9]
MSRSKSSNRWLQEHFSDPFVKMAQIEQYRSRAVYKLKEIDKKNHLLKPDMTIIDLGSAPGSWAQYISRSLREQCRIIALDILPMQPMPNVEFIQGDFSEDNVLQQLMVHIPMDGVDLLLSDMAPNMSGIAAVDAPRVMLLTELAVELASTVLKPGGNLLLKVFHGAGFDELLKSTRKIYRNVKICKPAASRPRSREIYFLAKGYNL